MEEANAVFCSKNEALKKNSSLIQPASYCHNKLYKRVTPIIEYLYIFNGKITKKNNQGINKKYGYPMRQRGTNILLQKYCYITSNLSEKIEHENIRGENPKQLLYIIF